MLLYNFAVTSTAELQGHAWDNYNSYKRTTVTHLRRLLLKRVPYKSIASKQSRCEANNMSDGCSRYYAKLRRIDTTTSNHRLTLQILR